jgi:hypothetical protein
MEEDEESRSKSGIQQDSAVTVERKSMSTGLAIKAIEEYDPIRETSGKEILRNKLPITIEPKCLSHLVGTQEKNLTLKLFKVACLAYSPAEVYYREHILARGDLIQMRRNLVDHINKILPKCDIFKKQAIYPKRYFDDMMVEDKGLHSKIESIQTLGDVYNLQAQVSKSKISGGYAHNDSSTNINSENHINFEKIRLGHSPSH